MDDPATREKLEQARRALLDLTTRNRLLHTPRHRKRSRAIEVTDELAEEVFRLLVREKRAMSFLAEEPGAEAPTEDLPSLAREEEAGEPFAGLAQPEESADEDRGERGIAARHRDTRLQTPLAPEALQKRLLGMFYDARTYEEEQGVSVLYLACGFLKWFEEGAPEKERFAPLLLIPVALERRSAATRFRIRWTEEEIATNLSLQAKLKADFGIELPEVGEIEDLSPAAYCDEVGARVAGLPGWEVLPNDVVLAFFSFAKFLMYRDLDPDEWSAGEPLLDHALLAPLLGDGFAEEPPLFPEDALLDDFVEPVDLVHVLDADSSQALAIEEVRRGRSLVIQGPPGTGKSQTIANLIGAAVREGRTVLFVAEKRAALEVVARRLEAIGLGDVTLELHSHKARKRQVLDELGRTLQLGRPRGADVEAAAARLKDVRDRLNAHARLLHTRVEPMGLTPYRVVGELVRLRAARVPPADFGLEGPEGWTPDDVRRRRGLLEEYARHVEALGTPGEHPWRGVRRDALLPMDRERLGPRVAAAGERTAALRDAGVALASALGVEPPRTAGDVRAQALLAKHVAALPPCDASALADPAWGSRREGIGALVAAGLALQRCRAALEGRVIEAAWEEPVESARRDLARFGPSWLRWFRGPYRRAQRLLRELCLQPPPKALGDRLSLLDTLLEGQRARRAVREGDALGAAAFGARWGGEASDFAALDAVAKWEEEARTCLRDDFRAVAARAPDAAVLERLRPPAEGAGGAFAGELEGLFGALDLDLAEAFDAASPEDVALDALAGRLAAWRERAEEVDRWIAWRLRDREVRAQGMDGLAARVYDGRVGPGAVADAFSMAYCEAALKDMMRQQPSLASFDSLAHDRAVDEFRRLDRERITLARGEVARAHASRLPRADGGIGQLGLLRREIEKKRRHLPLRRLLREAGRAIQATKPVFMMSPMSVAQYLEPGAVGFDLLLMDEASQVEPVDAFGAIARCRQIVVVGDDKQLPPTPFFRREAADAIEEEDQVADLESILKVCNAQGLNRRMLRWHYRSRHDSLIAVSNREFYENRLCVVPNPWPDRPDLGLQWRFVADGVFDRGGSATNRAEARAVADAVLEHARMHPDRTLGVGAFSIQQRDAILDELERRWREAPDVRDWFGTGGPEPFFVKNLETIQGDERDVIFLSVGYAKDAEGRMSMNLGPLNRDGGERRLNVLITRARQRCEVFSSITADDLDLERGPGPGVAALKTFLAYAERREIDLPRATGREADSVFEEQVAEALRAAGHGVTPQVGIAGFFVDLAVKDPEQPGRYVLGIECDGASYHSARSARDRDRLRQQVLEDHGWTIHRIWSTDWFRRPQEQLRRTVEAIEGARQARPAPRSGPAVEAAVVREPAPAAGPPPLAAPYAEAHFEVPGGKEPHELPLQSMASVVKRVVDAEGPVHGDEIARRVAALWDKGRTGSRIAGAVQEGLAHALERGWIVRDGEFFHPPGMEEVPVRDRSAVKSASLRTVEMLPPAEVRAALLALVRAHHGVAREEAIRETAYLLGYRATSAQLAQAVAREIDTLLFSGALEERNEVLVAAGGAGAGA